MEKRERLALLIRHFANGSQAAFSRKTGVNKSAISRMLSGRMEITDRQLYKIYSAIPEAEDVFNRGEAARSKSDAERISELEAEVRSLKADIAIKNRMIDALLRKEGY